MRNIYLFEFLAEAFRWRKQHYECLVVLVETIAVLQGPQSIDNGGPGIEKFALKLQAREDFA